MNVHRSRLYGVAVPVLIAMVQLSSCVPGTRNVPVGGVYLSHSAGANFDQSVKRVEDPSAHIARTVLRSGHQPLHNPDHVYIAAAGQGLVFSDNGGESWRVIPVPVADSLDVVALQSGVLVVAGVGGDGQGMIVRSLDQGKSWETVLTVPVPAESRRFELLREARVTSVFLSIEPDPFVPDRLYAGSALGTVLVGEQSAKVWRTIHTVTTNRFSQNPSRSAGIAALFPSPSRAGEVLLILGNGSLIRLRASQQADIVIPKLIGRSGPFGPDTTPRFVFDVTYIRDFPGALLASTEGGAVISRDEGKTWQELAVPVDSSQKFNTSQVRVSPTNSNRLFVTVNSILYRSEDSGQTWNTFDFKLTEYGITSIFIHPNNAARVLAIVQPLRS